MGHDPAATGSGRLLIKTPKQTGLASPKQPVDRSRRGKAIHESHRMSPGRQDLISREPNVRHGPR